ncbi:MAG: hypothetical protein JW881_10675 [Spirochaetales bacterium]|nr:hypothetical protein [Spirochaetales bacterium]
MVKKEYLLVFVIAGLAVAYALLSLFNFLTGGRIAKVFNRKLAVGTMIIAMTAIFNAGAFAQTTATDTPTPTPVYGTLEPTSEPDATPVVVPVYTTPPPTETEAPVPSEPVVVYGAPQPGDVNLDFKVDIVDSLLIAQYYVGSQPANFLSDYADVDNNGKIDIIDALLVAQKYVGAIDRFPDKSGE